MDNSTPTSLYRYYDSGGILLYVGITAQRSMRNIQHNSDKYWWKYVHSQEVEHYPSRAKALAAEKALIGHKRPPFNVQHNPDKGQLGPAYIQYREATASRPGAGTLMYSLRGRVPLFVSSRESKTVTLHSLPEHYALASRMVFPDDLYYQSGTMRANTITTYYSDMALFVTIRASWASAIGDMQAVLTRDKGAYKVRRFEDRAQTRIEVSKNGKR